MNQLSWWLVDFIGPAILVIVLIWLVIRGRPSRNEADYRKTEQGTRELYREEDERRRDRTDEL